MVRRTRLLVSCEHFSPSAGLHRRIIPRLERLTLLISVILYHITDSLTKSAANQLECLIRIANNPVVLVKSLQL